MAPARSYPPMSGLGQSPLKCNARDVSTFTPTATEQRTSGDVSNVPNTRRSRLYAKDRPTIAVEVRELNRSCTLPSSALNASIDERIEPLSHDKLRGIVPLNPRAGAA
jgi:hypothetical protein